MNDVLTRKVERVKPDPSTSLRIYKPEFDFNRILTGDARELLHHIPKESVDLSFWSPPYFVGKSYEKGWSFDDWQSLVREVTLLHSRVVKPGGFMVVNIGDILCFRDETMPRFQANNVRRKKIPITREQIIALQERYPLARRTELAEMLGCSEQTIQRRLEHNNVRGGKQNASTRIKLTGCLVEQWAMEAGFYLYDQRIWHKDPCWANSRWHSNSYRAVDEFEHIYIFWQPGITEYDRGRLTNDEWSEWGSRGVWNIRSVTRNDRHEAEFPEMLAYRVIRLFSPAQGVVLDPFVGSGTTTFVARKLGRRWFGIETSPHYATLARKRTHAN
ncbi:MAG: site-specific DNA-methyltransferase [Chloroflexi bacterium]|nr:site-specific DNA-methyltransferase [Chloroflexota bacterium]MCY4247382.1 site-specific DNA-methyltransferase [Chloroflexota bacterium]